MSPLVDTSRFQLGLAPAEPGDPLADPAEWAEEAAFLKELETEARAYAYARAWGPLVSELLLAFGVGRVIGLYLVRFSHALPDGDMERWAVVGDLPPMNFETEDAQTPARALQLYCAIAQDWADNVIAGADLSESYPIDAPATKENAKALLSRVELIRTNFVPEAERFGPMVGEGDPKA